MKKHDDLILNAFKKNDEIALKYLFDYYYKPLCVYAIKFIDDFTIAKDIVQEVFINLWEKKFYRNLKGSLKNYLFVSVKNRSINYLNKQNKFPSEYIDQIKDEFIFHNFDESELEEMKKKLHEEIDKLPAQQKKILRLLIFNKIKYKEVAEELDISINTVKTHYSKALKQLRKVIDIIVILLLP